MHKLAPSHLALPALLRIRLCFRICIKAGSYSERPIAEVLIEDVACDGRMVRFWLSPEEYR